MASAYLLQIVYADGSRPTQFLAGGQGERDIVDAITKHITSTTVASFSCLIQFTDEAA